MVVLVVGCWCARLAVDSGMENNRAAWDGSRVQACAWVVLRLDGSKRGRAPTLRGDPPLSIADDWIMGFCPCRQGPPKRGEDGNSDRQSALSISRPIVILCQNVGRLITASTQLAMTGNDRE